MTKTTKAKPAVETEVVEEKDLKAVAEELGGTIASPEVNWTMKLVHPDGTSEPDFITFKGVDPYVVYQQVNQMRALLHEDGWKEAQGRSFGGGTPKTSGQTAQAEAGEVQVEAVNRVTLAKRADGKLELGLFGTLGNGQPMEFPFLRAVLKLESMKNLLLPVGYEIYPDDPVSLPLDHDTISWNAHWKQGRKTQSGGHYKDIVKLEQGI